MKLVGFAVIAAVTAANKKCPNLKQFLKNYDLNDLLSCSYDLDIPGATCAKDIGLTCRMVCDVAPKKVTTTTTTTTVPPTTTTIATTTTIPKKVVKACRNVDVDVAFVLDGSGSVTEENFIKQKQFVKDVVLPLNLHQTGSRASVVQFSDWPELSIDWTSNLDEFYTGVDAIEYMGYRTFTADAMKFTYNNLIKNNARDGVKKFVVLITDGASTNGVSEKDALHQFGISNFALGIGPSTNRTELDILGSKPSKQYVFDQIGFDALTELKEKLAVKICKDELVTIAP